MDDLALRSWADVEGDPVKIRAGVEEILERQRYSGGPWLFKDVKLVFCWETWAEAFPDATWVTVWRDPDMIVESFRRWGLAKRVSFDHRRVVAEHHSRARGIPAIEVRPDDLFRGEVSQYRKAAEEVGLEWDMEKVKRVIDPEMFHADPAVFSG